MYLFFFFFFFDARNIYLFGWMRFVYKSKGFCLGCELARLCPGLSPCCKWQRGCFHAGLDSLVPATPALPFHVPQAFGCWRTLRDAACSTNQS